MIALAVAGAGALGAVCRYALDGVVQQRWRGPFPMGTFVVNVSGSFVLGLIAGVFLRHPSASNDIKVIAGTGFVGAYTTFSTLMYESLQLLREGSVREVALNLLGSLALGLAVAFSGLWIGQRF